MFYLLASTSFIALPHEPVLLYYGKQFGIYLPLLYSIIPTILGCYIDYAVLGPVLRHKKLSNIRDSNITKKLIGFFQISPFSTIFLSALSPLPFYPVRIVSIVSDYSAKKYVLAVLLGRLPRFFVLSAGGRILGFTNAEILLIFSPILIWYLWNILYIKTRRISKFISSSPN